MRESRLDILTVPEGVTMKDRHQGFLHRAANRFLPEVTTTANCRKFYRRTLRYHVKVLSWRTYPSVGKSPHTHQLSLIVFRILSFFSVFNGCAFNERAEFDLAHCAIAFVLDECNLLNLDNHLTHFPLPMATSEAKPKRSAGAVVVLKGEAWVRGVVKEPMNENDHCSKAPAQTTRLWVLVLFNMNHYFFW
jgi:hypothetical protein